MYMKIINYIYFKIGQLLYRYPSMRKYMPDKMYLQQYYARRMGYYMDFNNPKTFNEKLQWLKLYDRKPIYTTMADKIEAKKFVSEKIGVQHIIPTLEIYNSFDEIDFDKLPNQFVMKCSHDSGSVVICKDKSSFDLEHARCIIETGLKRSWYQIGREWAYKNIKPRILIEQFMIEGPSEGLTDYKFYCFNGIPKFLYVSHGLNDHENAFVNYLTMDWQLAPFHRHDFREYKTLPRRPSNYNQMIQFSKTLSENTPFLRVDFYEIDGRVYFSELTFYPGCGMTPFDPVEYDKKWGDMIILPKS